MLESLLSSFFKDPLDMVLDFIEDQNVTITIGDRLTLRFKITKESEKKSENGTITVYKFEGELKRGG